MDVSASVRVDDQDFSANDTAAIWFAPRNIGMSKPQSKHIFEFVIFRSESAGISSEIYTLLSKYDVKAVKQRTDIDHRRGVNLNVFFFDFEGANCSPFELARQIEQIHGVAKVQFKSREGALFSSYTFPVTLNNKDRAFVIRAKLLFKMEQRLKEIMGSGGDAIMFEQGRTVGAGAASAQKEILGAESSNENSLSTTFRDASKALGIGILSYAFSDDRSMVNVVLREPLVDESGECNSRFMFGIIAGGLEFIHGVSLKVSRWAYDKTTKVLRLKFSVESKPQANSARRSFS